MSKYKVNVGSVTHAIKGKDVLNANGFRASFGRNMKPSGQEGCGYVIYVDGEIDRAVNLLRDNYVRVVGYKQLSDRS